MIMSRKKWYQLWYILVIVIVLSYNKYPIMQFIIQEILAIHGFGVPYWIGCCIVGQFRYRSTSEYWFPWLPVQHTSSCLMIMIQTQWAVERCACIVNMKRRYQIHPIMHCSLWDFLPKLTELIQILHFRCVSSLSPHMTTCTKNPIGSNALWDGPDIFSCKHEPVTMILHIHYNNDIGCRFNLVIITPWQKQTNPEVFCT